MKTQTFTASISHEDEWFVAQCLEVDVASQGKSEDEAIENLAEALELYFEPPRPTVKPKIRTFEVNVNSDDTAFLSAETGKSGILHQASTRQSREVYP